MHRLSHYEEGRLALMDVQRALLKDSAMYPILFSNAVGCLRSLAADRLQGWLITSHKNQWREQEYQEYEGYVRRAHGRSLGIVIVADDGDALGNV